MAKHKNHKSWVRCNEFLLKSPPIKLRAVAFDTYERFFPATTTIPINKPDEIHIRRGQGNLESYDIHYLVGLNGQKRSTNRTNGKSEDIVSQLKAYAPANNIIAIPFAEWGVDIPAYIVFLESLGSSLGASTVLKLGLEKALIIEKWKDPDLLDRMRNKNGKLIETAHQLSWRNKVLTTPEEMAKIALNCKLRDPKTFEKNEQLIVKGYLNYGKVVVADDSGMTGFSTGFVTEMLKLMGIPERDIIRLVVILELNLTKLRR